MIVLAHLVVLLFKAGCTYTRLGTKSMSESGGSVGAEA